MESSTDASLCPRRPWPVSRRPSGVVGGAKPAMAGRGTYRPGGNYTHYQLVILPVREASRLKTAQRFLYRRPLRPLRFIAGLHISRCRFLRVFLTYICNTVGARREKVVYTRQVQIGWKLASLPHVCWTLLNPAILPLWDLPRRVSYVQDTQSSVLVVCFHLLTTSIDVFFQGSVDAL